MACYSCVFELCVHRAQGTVINFQWIQKTEESVIITGVYTHLLPITKLYETGFLGWFKVHDSVWDECARLHILAEEGIAEEARKAAEPEEDDVTDLEADFSVDEQ